MKRRQVLRWPPVGVHDEPPIVSVAELDRRLKRAVEGAAGDVWVEGEVSGARPAASGHIYFLLKDEREDASIECVMYRSASLRSRQLVSDGARVQLRGRATVWAPRGRLQFTAEHARAAGRGALLEALEALKAKLSAEGLFATEKKRPLPPDPRLVGVVTSRSGAAIHDIVKVAFRRGAVRIVLSPALVQGQGARERLIEALDWLEKVRGLDAIIVGRGGGSADDLMVFNDESVVRRVAACRVPVVSAVGHEVDVTLTNLAADARAATPSQAAELLVPDAAARARVLEHLGARLHRAMRARLAEDDTALSKLRAAFSGHRVALLERGQAIDDARRSLERAIDRRLVRYRAELERWSRRLAARHPRAVVAKCRAEVVPALLRLEAAMRERLETSHAHLGTRAARLDAMSPLGVLGRGYAIATTEDGHIIRAAADVCEGQRVAVRVQRGTFLSRVEAGANVGETNEHAGRTPATEVSS